MKVVKTNNKQEMSLMAANIIEEVLQTKENPVLGFATGSTPELMYEILVERYNKGKISFEHATTFNLDEYAGLAKDHPSSYRYYMETKFFNRVNIPSENRHVPNGVAEDIENETAMYEEKLAAAGQMDVQILGIGLNGHIGFNEPGSDPASRTRVVELELSTREVNSRFFNDVKEVPTKAITMGLGTILDAKKIVLLVQGDKKAEILEKVVHGDVTTEVPASFLQRHPNAIVITDIDV